MKLLINQIIVDNGAILCSMLRRLFRSNITINITTCE